jgi:acetolactate synthase I/II/III large subunit
MMDSVPMIVICGQQVTWMLGKDAFQEADIFGITIPVVKHNYLVKDTNDLPRIAREAYHIATTGRPGPVLIDVPKDISARAPSPATSTPHGSARLPSGEALDRSASRWKARI